MVGVSVIIPVYNVSAYIEKCARSAFEQTLDDLEIIFVNDCSTDNSVEIIEKVISEYANSPKKSRIVHMSTNGGLAAVRRQGIIHATGRYVIHLDGDDWIDPDYYESLYNRALETDADIVVGDEVMEYSDKVVPKENLPLPPSGKEIMRNWYKHTIGLFCHNKLVRRSLYTDNNVLPWVGLNMWEDNGLFARLFYYADKVAQAHGPVYHYNRCNVSAMTSGYGTAQVEQMISVARNLTDFFESKPDAEDFRKTLLAFQYLAKLNLVTDSYSNLKLFKTIFPESDSIVTDLDPAAFSMKGKIRFWFVKYHLGALFITFFKIKNLFS